MRACACSWPGGAVLQASKCECTRRHVLAQLATNKMFQVILWVEGIRYATYAAAVVGPACSPLKGGWHRGSG
jgi:hypothetical protein